MTHFKRYPHVKDLILHYATATNERKIALMLEQGISSENDAILFAQFIWKMVEQIGADSESGTKVLGSTDNTDTMPDIDYEVSSFLANFGYAEIWDKICDEQ
ncbi:MAG TPA: hypothetical protein VLC79_08980 [Cellvibrio sp.]|nr:hypothetical protein [Cellvibrio sp.]